METSRTKNNQLMSKSRSQASFMDPNSSKLSGREANNHETTSSKQAKELGSGQASKSTLTHPEDLKNEISIVCKLFNENKINIRNAWNLRIIDVIQQMSHKSIPDVLTVIGVPLEIAGKVYGMRIDDLHCDALKMAGNLLQTFSKGNENNPDQSMSKVEEESANTTNATTRQAKKKRNVFRTDKSHILNQDPSTFLGRVPKMESTVFSIRTDPTCSAIGNLLTNRIKTDPTGCNFLLGSKDKAWQWTKGNDRTVKMGNRNSFPISLDSDLLNYNLCNEFSEFRLDKWKKDQGVCLNTSNHLSEAVMDTDGIPIPELDGSVVDVFANPDANTYYHHNESIEDSLVSPSLVHKEVEHIMDFQPREQDWEQGMEKSAYSFNNLVHCASGKMDQIWAGPNHWKLKFIKRGTVTYTGKDAQALVKQKNPNRKTTKRFEVKPIDFTHSNLCLPFKSGKKSTKRITCDAEKFCLPLLSSQCGKFMENVQYFSILPRLTPNPDECTEEVECDVQYYNYNNPNDSQYCPEVTKGSVGADISGDDNFDVESNDDLKYNDDRPLLENLVDVPEMVPQVFLSYATRVKNVDIKVIRQAIWCTLTRKKIFDEAAPVLQTSFTQMCKELHHSVPAKIVQDLNGPIVFTALLHLCNRHNLKLQRSHNDVDFDIST